jgi:DNA-binding response OmpR family regulator
MDGYLTKPSRPRELDDVLENYLARRAQELVTAGRRKAATQPGDHEKIESA